MVCWRIFLVRVGCNHNPRYPASRRSVDTAPRVAQERREPFRHAASHGDMDLPVLPWPASVPSRYGVGCLRLGQSLGMGTSGCVKLGKIHLPCAIHLKLANHIRGFVCMHLSKCAYVCRCCMYVCMYVCKTESARKSLSPSPTRFQAHGTFCRPAVRALVTLFKVL